jgi:SH3 domain protein
MGMIAFSKRKRLFLFALPVLFFAAVGTARADRRYVSDRLLVTLREGKGAEFKVIKALRTDTPVEVIEEDGQYARVRTEKGEEGWLQKQYLTPDTPKTKVIEGLKLETVRLMARIEELEQKQDPDWAEFEAAKRSHAKEVEAFENRAKKIKAEAARNILELRQAEEKYNTLVANSKEIVTVVGERDRLKKENIKLHQEVKELRDDNAHLVRTGMLWWFLAGGGVFFVGLISGKLSRKKSYY